MNNVIKCYKEFFGYFNALETNCVMFQVAVYKKTEL